MSEDKVPNIRFADAPAPVRKWEELTSEDKLEQIRMFVSELNNRINSLGIVVRGMAEQFKAQEVERKIASGAGVKIPGIRG